ncbi:class I SAM-dependent methyltransferase [Streptomyces pinistramenti]|uniref:class I SAM-dependent methyltransferase n=1 Tax=Streptomyces pinistramenti TaxID=2884812 RepID=UPI001D094319|nr:class I SAM-dependent methyltransferase [Streptomyces pinistramenti]MCB5910263.1 class I SAM-dependent methyltransferase [Streptomyces pinistramenti]
MKAFDSPSAWDRMEAYDATPWAAADDEEAASAFLAKIADGGPALELGIGTGRVALTLARSGVAVTGIESSPKMLEQLRAKPGGAELDVVLGDFADVPVEGEFSLVYCVYHSFFLLLTQEEQLRCFQNVADRLKAGGAFVLQTFVLDADQYGREEWTDTMHLGDDEAVLLMSLHDATEQRVNRQQIVLTTSGPRFYPMSFRYAWPSELDLMARMAGLTREGRWKGWDGEPFPHPGHVTVYRKNE